jgi:hypothetical protein
MGLVTGITKRTEVPHEAGQWIELRVLSWLRLEDARRKKMNALAGYMRELGEGAAHLGRKNGAPPVEDGAEDRLVGYDIGSLLRGGIVGWSYGAFNVAQIEDLDEQTAEWAARELLAMSQPQERDVKAPASPSTAT